VPNVLPVKASRYGAFPAVEAAHDLATPNVMVCLDRAFNGVNGAVDVISSSADSGLVETSVRSPVFSLRQGQPSPVLSGRPAMGRKLCRRRIAIDFRWVSRDYEHSMAFQ
jgi:hypothetical protein